MISDRWECIGSMCRLGHFMRQRTTPHSRNVEDRKRWFNKVAKLHQLPRLHSDHWKYACAPAARALLWSEPSFVA